MVIARLYLADNACQLQFVPADAVRMVEGVAAGTIAEAELAAWLRKRISYRLPGYLISRLYQGTTSVSGLADSAPICATWTVH